MVWLNDWIGLPYCLGGRGPMYDCLGLWLAVRSARGLSTPPDPACDQREALRGRHIASLSPQFTRVSRAAEGDLLLFRRSSRSLHVGYALDARDMLHIEDEVRMSQITRYDTGSWRPLLTGAYRHVG